MSCIPRWHQTPGGSWTCDDPIDRAIAIKALLWGFDLVDFDRWLAELEPCNMRDELLAQRARLRSLAEVDPVGDPPVDNPEVVRAFFVARQQSIQMQRDTLERLKLARFTIDREEFLLPLAKKGVGVKKKKGDVGAVTRWLRANRLDGETAKQFWDRIAEGGAGRGEEPIYIDGDVMCVGGSEQTITFEAFKKRIYRNGGT